VLAPLRAEWEALRAHVDTFVQTTDLSGLGERAAQTQRNRHINGPIADFLGRLQSLKVLDPACGSGNFLYVAMQQLKELEREVVAFAQSVGAPGFQLIGPRQFYGLELSVFAHELASIVVWIGYLQWNHLNGISNRQTPILERLDTLLDGEGETEWPEAEFIVGNPPFLGDKRMRGELGDAYVEKLRELFRDRVPGQADFVCYWFEKSRAQIAQGKAKRAGLISTNSIRGGASRKVLESIKETGDLFMAWADEPWILEGAAVRVSLVGFDDGTETARTLDGQPAAVINPDLTGNTDVSQAKALPENQGVAFQGTIKMGDFNLPFGVVEPWLDSPNPDGRSNREVIRPWVNGMDITRRPSNTWVIDFGIMSKEEAEQYITPFEYVAEKVRPGRKENRDAHAAKNWWLHHRPRPEMRAALKGLLRYICTPRVSKYRLFAWLSADVLPDSATIAIARDDDYTFGVLHSKLHEVWSLAMGTSLEDRPRYTPTTCFETFPFPRPTETQRADIEKWAKYLDDVRTQLLGAEQTRTLTKLYNYLTELRATRDSKSPVYPLLLAHEKLDAAVAAAYGWAWPLSDDEILAALLALNLERAVA
jgi:type II restriction/modification system DNA methylase subunit YeeA